MEELTWVDRERLFPSAMAALEQVEVVLDIGPGIRPQPYIQPVVHVCCEPFMQYVEKLQEIAAVAKDRTYVILNMTWADAVRCLPPKSVDTVILSDVIEHLEKEEGHRLLDATLRLARRQVGIFTTLGFVPQHHPQGKDAWGLDGMDWQEHKSGWMPEDFGAGWAVIACKDYHTLDHMGAVRSKTEGAIWAIYTVDGSGVGFSHGHALRQLLRGTSKMAWRFANSSVRRIVRSARAALLSGAGR
jgi:hypothetical protein